MSADNERSRRKSITDVCGVVNNVDVLVAQLAYDAVNAATLNTYAGSNRVYTVVVAFNGYLYHRDSLVKLLVVGLLGSYAEKVREPCGDLLLGGLLCQ